MLNTFWIKTNNMKKKERGKSNNQLRNMRSNNNIYKNTQKLYNKNNLKVSWRHI